MHREWEPKGSRKATGFSYVGRLPLPSARWGADKNCAAFFFGATAWRAGRWPKCIATRGQFNVVIGDDVEGILKSNGDPHVESTAARNLRPISCAERSAISPDGYRRSPISLEISRRNNMARNEMEFPRPDLRRAENAW